MPSIVTRAQEADKVLVPEAQRIADTLQYPYRLSGVSLTLTIDISNFNTADPFAFDVTPITTDIMVNPRRA